MKLTQIATLLNTVLVPNVFGKGEDGSHNPITITEDLRNVVDLGTALSDVDADTLKNYAKDLAVGIFNIYVDTRAYKDETYDLFLSEQDYGGAIARIKCKLFDATDTPILSLVSAGNSGPDYTDGKYYGAEWNEKLYTVDYDFQIKYSLSTEFFKKSFTSAEGVAKLVSMIESAIDNSLRVQLNTLARGVLRKLILAAYQGSRNIALITTFNTINNLTSSDPGYITLANWKQSVTFKLWVQTLVLELRKYMTDMNEKYNDGTIQTFCPEDETRCILLTEFAAELDVALGSVYHKEMVDGLGTYRTINYWQNGTKDLLPQIASGSLHDQVVERVKDAGAGVTGDVVTIDHVVGLFYDKYSAFLTNKLNKTTTKYVPEADFTTFFHHIAKSAAIDTRNTAVILTLA